MGESQFLDFNVSSSIYGFTRTNEQCFESHIRVRQTRKETKRESSWMLMSRQPNTGSPRAQHTSYFKERESVCVCVRESVCVRERGCVCV